MFAVAGLLGVLAGGAIAYFAPRFPAHVEALETGAGILLIGGFALAGCTLPGVL